MLFKNKKEPKVDGSLQELSGKNQKSKKAQKIEKKEGISNKQTKEDIINKVNDLRKRMRMHPDFEKYADKLLEMNNDFISMSETNNPSTIVIDNFIYASLIELENHFNRKNSVAIRIILDTIKQYFDDRFQSGQYYQNKDYQRIKVMYCKISIENETKISQVAAIKARCLEFANEYNISKNTNLLNKINSGREQIKMINGFVDRYEKTLRLLEKAIFNIEQTATMHQLDNQFDFLAEMEDIISKANLNAADFAVIDKLNNKIDEASRKYAAAPEFKADVEVDSVVEVAPEFIDPNEFK